MKLLITGGCGFIGSNFIKVAVKKNNFDILNVDKLTYSSNKASLKDVNYLANYSFKKLDICNKKVLSSTIAKYQPDSIIHFAAETHVDRSIETPSKFIETNIIGTQNLLDVSLKLYRSMSNKRKKKFRFLHISTDEVFGDLTNKRKLFNEESPYNPSSPYAASKASSDHLVRAWGRTYNFPFIITNCSNNYGPFQFPEKFIPRMILNAIENRPMPIYGDGFQIRDWLHVNDHIDALITILDKGKVGETYNIGGFNEIKNIDVATNICKYLEITVPEMKYKISHFNKLITYVKDRPGHDTRYAVDASKISKELSWSPKYKFDDGLIETINWYLANRKWWKPILSKYYDIKK